MKIKKKWKIFGEWCNYSFKQLLFIGLYIFDIFWIVSYYENIFFLCVGFGVI